MAYEFGYYLKRKRKGTMHIDTLREGLELCFLYSQKYEVELFDSYTGEVYFYTLDDRGDNKFYINDIARSVLARSI